MIWSSSLGMYHQLLVRKTDRRCIVIINECLPIRTEVTQIYRDGLALPCTSNIEFGRLCKQVFKMAWCNWLKPELGTPELYCSWACTPLMGFKGQVYWEEEAVYLQATPLGPALLSKWAFWGHYNFTCEKVKSPTKTRMPRGQSTAIGDNQNSSDGKTQTIPVTCTTLPVTTELPDSTLRLLDQDFNLKSDYHRIQTYQLIWECVTQKLINLAPCFWNVNKDCKTHFPMITWAKKSRFYTLKEVYGQMSNAYHDHFVGAFLAGYTRTGQGIKGPHCLDMYVQKLPSHADLAMSVFVTYILGHLIINSIFQLYFQAH